MRPDSERSESLSAAGGRGSRPRRARRPQLGARLRRQAPELRPRSVGEILDLATEVLLARFLVVGGIAFLIWVPVVWLRGRLLTEADDSADLGAMLVDLGLGVGLELSASMLIGAACCLVTYGYLRGAGPGPARLLRALPGLVVVTLTNSLAVALVLPFTCGVGSVFLLWRLYFAPCVVVLERHDPIRALGRSWTLTRAGFWRWVCLLGLAVAYTLPLTLAAREAQVGTLHDLLHTWFPNLGGVPVDAIVLAAEGLLLAVPSAFVGVLLTVFYTDTLVRREGLDLWVRLGQLNARPGAGEPA